MVLERLAFSVPVDLDLVFVISTIGVRDLGLVGLGVGGLRLSLPLEPHHHAGRVVVCSIHVGRLLAQDRDVVQIALVVRLTDVGRSVLVDVVLSNEKLRVGRC